MEDMLTKLGMEEFIQRFREEKIVPGTVCKLSKIELKSLGLNCASEIMKLRVECIKYGNENASMAAAEDSFRKQYDIRKETIENLMDAGFSMSDMTKILSTSESTIYRRMKKYNIGKRAYTEIEDEELDLVLAWIIAEFPRCGEQMLKHLLAGKGIKVYIFTIVMQMLYELSMLNILLLYQTFA